MGHGRTDGFRHDAVRIALSIGLTRKQVAGDLGVGLSTLDKWISARRDADVVSKEDISLAHENDRIGRENRLLQEESDILERGKADQKTIWGIVFPTASSSRAKSHEVQVHPLPGSGLLANHKRGRVSRSPLIL